MDYGQFKQNFEAFLDEFYQQKSNSLKFSNSTNPNRLFRIQGLSLATANETFTKYSIPFRSIHNERIYSTATPTTDIQGSIKLALDYDNINNTANSYKLMQVNDSFISDQSFAQCFLAWDAQPDTSIDIAFMIDIDFRAGSAASAIVGEVSVSSASALATKMVPSSTVTKSVNNSNDSYTIPAGFYGIMVGSIEQTTATASIKINTVSIMAPPNITCFYTASGIYLATGDVVAISSNAASNNVRIHIALFPI